MTRNGSMRARKYVTRYMAVVVLLVIYCLATAGVSILMMSAADTSAQAKGHGGGGHGGGGHGGVAIVATTGAIIGAAPRHPLGRRQGSWPLLAWPLVGLRCRPVLAIVPRGLDLDLRLSTTHANAWRASLPTTRYLSIEGSC